LFGCEIFDTIEVRNEVLDMDTRVIYGNYRGGI
jgi:hypothetical protein